MLFLLNITQLTFVFFLVLLLFLGMNNFYERMGRARLEAMGERQKEFPRETYILTLCFALLINAFLYQPFYN